MGKIGTFQRDGIIIFDPPEDDGSTLDDDFEEERLIRPSAPGIIQLQFDGAIDDPYYQVFFVEDEKHEWREFDNLVLLEKFLLSKVEQDEWCVTQACVMLHNFRLVNLDLFERATITTKGYAKVGTMF